MVSVRVNLSGMSNFKTILINIIKNTLLYDFTIYLKFQCLVASVYHSAPDDPILQLEINVSKHQNSYAARDAKRIPFVSGKHKYR